MSHTALDPTPSRGGSNSAGPGPAGVGAGPSFPRVLLSEFIKFRTLLSTLMLFGSTSPGPDRFRRPLGVGHGSVRRGRGVRPARRRRLRRAGRRSSPSASRRPDSRSPS